MGIQYEVQIGPLIKNGFLFFSYLSPKFWNKIGHNFRKYIVLYFKNQSIWKNSQNNLKTYYLKVFQFNIYLHILLLLLIFSCRMNLFLGVFVPNKNRPALWDRDAPQDVYLHSPEICRSVDKTKTNYRVSQSKVYKVILLWWGYRFDFLLI